MSIIDKKYNKYQKLVKLYPSDHELMHKFNKYSFLKNNQSGGGRRVVTAEPSKELIDKIQNLIDKSKINGSDEKGMNKKNTGTRIKGYRKMKGGNLSSDDQKIVNAIKAEALGMDNFAKKTEETINKQRSASNSIMDAIEKLRTACDKANEALANANASASSSADKEENEALKKDIKLLVETLKEALSVINAYKISDTEINDVITEYKNRVDRYFADNQELLQDNR